jgi:hypothetical protein
MRTKARGPSGWTPARASCIYRLRLARVSQPPMGQPHWASPRGQIRQDLLGSRSSRGLATCWRVGRRGGGRIATGGGGRWCGGIAGRSSRSSRLVGRSGGRRRRSGCGLGAGGFLLRAGRQHQRRNECAKSKFGFHRSVPRREARVVRKRCERACSSFRESGVRIAAANSIESPADWKQLRLRTPCTVHVTEGGARVWRVGIRYSRPDTARPALQAL